MYAFRLSSHFAYHLWWLGVPSSHLEVHDLLLAELPEGDAPGHEDGGRLGHAEHLPTEALEEAGNLQSVRVLCWIKKNENHNYLQIGREYLKIVAMITCSKLFCGCKICVTF